MVLMTIPGSGLILRQRELPLHALSHSFRFRACIPLLHTNYLNEFLASYAVIRSEALLYDADHCVFRDSARDLRYGKPIPSVMMVDEPGKFGFLGMISMMTG